jgi:cobalt-zinc-cadmium efflux system membrane fusion protein
MKPKRLGALTLLSAAVLTMLGCGGAQGNREAEAPPPPQVVHEQDSNVVQVDHPEQFPLSTAAARESRSALVVTGVVTPDVSRTIPVISLASGRVVAIEARLGDRVQKGQKLLSVRSDDVSSGYSDYRKAVADEALARAQLDRAKDLHAHGAISMNDLQIAQDTEDKAVVDLETSQEHLRLLGNDPNAPSGIVDIVAPISGVITDQQVTNSGGLQALGANPFTISDLSKVWVICDVYENDLPNVNVGETADIRLNAYPDRALTGRISNIGEILDPAIRTAKVRIEVSNPGLIRVGMFATATFHGLQREVHTVIPASAILHLHDRNWVYVPADANRFRRQEISSGEVLPDQMQEVLSGLQAGQKVVTKALDLENTVDNQ